MVLDFVFNPLDNRRSEHAIHLFGPHGGIQWSLKVSPDIEHPQIYLVPIYNLNRHSPMRQTYFDELIVNFDF